MKNIVSKKSTKSPSAKTAPSPSSKSTKSPSTKKSAKSPSAKRAQSPSDLIDAKLAELGDWRGEMLARLRALIKAAVPEVTEDWKWRGTPTWEHHGIICTGETYKRVVKTTFAKGAFLDDPAGLFNSSLEGNMRRAIDFREGEKVNEKALKALVRAAAAWNESSRLLVSSELPSSCCERERSE